MKSNVAFLIIGLVVGAAGMFAASRFIPGIFPQQAEASPVLQIPPEFRPENVRRAQVEARQRAENENTSVSIVPAGRPGSNEDLMMRSDLQTLRSQLELYRVQHLDLYPSAIAAVGTDGKKFAEQLTRGTDRNGKVGGTYGPYLQSWPDNPFVKGDNSSAVKLGKGPCPGDGTTGWYFDTVKNKLSPNDPQHKGW